LVIELGCDREGGNGFATPCCHLQRTASLIAKPVGYGLLLVGTQV
jgi:hypothetical protein